jgi:hypothetical protein
MSSVSFLSRHIKKLKVFSLIRSFTVVSRTRLQDVQLNVSHMFLPVSICASAAVPNPVHRADSFSITMRS